MKKAKVTESIDIYTYAGLALEGNLQMWVDAEASLELC